MLIYFNKVFIYLLKLLFPNLKKRICILNNEISLLLDKNKFILFILLFKKSTFFKFKQLIDIVCFDYLSKNRFLLLYHFLSLYLNIRLNLFLTLNEFNAFYSINAFYSSSV